jgi:hypothetical protein
MVEVNGIKKYGIKTTFSGMMPLLNLIKAVVCSKVFRRILRQTGSGDLLSLSLSLLRKMGWK